MRTQFDAIVAGAGIIGASIAYHLASSGLRVAVMDASGPAAAASGASDGAVSLCSKQPGALSRLAAEAIEYCGELALENQPLFRVFQRRPSYYFSTSGVEDDALDDLARRLKKMNGPVRVKSDVQGGKAPFETGSDVHRIVEIDGEGHMLGFAATDAFLTAAPIERLWPCRLMEFNATDTKVDVITDQGLFEATYLVLATGVSTNAYLPDLPLRRRSGQLIITERRKGGAGLPGAMTSASYLLKKGGINDNLMSPPVVVDPLETGQLLIGSTREDGGSARQTDFLRVKRILTYACRYYPPLALYRIIRVFAGVRAAVSDGLPIVGPVSGHRNVLAATGFEGDGICLAPLIGREVSALIRGGTVSNDVRSLSPQRFGASEAAS